MCSGTTTPHNDMVKRTGPESFSMHGILDFCQGHSLLTQLNIILSAAKLDLVVDILKSRRTLYIEKRGQREASKQFHPTQVKETVSSEPLTGM